MPSPDPPGGLPQSPTHYQVLGLSRAILNSSPTPTTASQLVKRAYRRALLRHHPDKAIGGGLHNHNSNSNNNSNSNTTTKATTTTRNSTATPTETGPSPTSYTIDQITSAHATLSSPRLRAEYDRHLLTLRANNTDPAIDPTAAGGGGASTLEDFQTGIETADLDDLEFADDDDDDNDNDRKRKSGGVGGGGEWYRGCRCGNERGFSVTEEDLGEAADLGEGEVVVGCRDCSLWLRVQFGVLEEG